MPRAKRKAATKLEKKEPTPDPIIDDAESEVEDADLDNEGPPIIDPYAVLGLESDATADDVKKAYRKMALQHHPDKVPPSEKDAAKTRFQEITFAYAVLSDERRRKRYDLTGSTAETLEDDEDFNWLNFYREQFGQVITEESINNFSKGYKGGAEERQDLLDAYTKHKGRLTAVYDTVMLSDILEDDDRFREIIDEEIAKGTIASYPEYERENNNGAREKAKAQERKRREEFDKREAKKEGNSKTKGPPKGKKQDAGGLGDLAALIAQRQKARHGNFFDHLEAKYAPARGAKRTAPMDEPPEEMFAATAARKKQKPRSPAKKHKDKEDDNSGSDDVGNSEEEEAPRKSKGYHRRSKRKAKV